MLHHRTTDPAKRAESIARREAEKVWRVTGSFSKYGIAFLNTYENALKEFHSQYILEDNYEKSFDH